MNYDLLTLDYIEQLKDINCAWYFTCDGDSQSAVVDIGDDQQATERKNGATYEARNRQNQAGADQKWNRN